MVSKGESVTTYSFFVHPDSEKIIYESTHVVTKSCPQKPDYSKGYVWRLYPDYDHFLSDLKTKSSIPLTKSLGYDTEATVTFYRSKIIYTFMVSGDLVLWSMDLVGKNKKQVTNNRVENFVTYFFRVVIEQFFLLTYMIQKRQILIFTRLKLMDRILKELHFLTGLMDLLILAQVVNISCFHQIKTTKREETPIFFQKNGITNETSSNNIFFTYKSVFRKH